MSAAIRNLLAAGYPAGDMPDLLDRECPVGTGRSAVAMFEAAAVGLVQRAAAGKQRGSADRRQAAGKTPGDPVRVGARPVDTASFAAAGSEVVDREPPARSVASAPAERSVASAPADPPAKAAPADPLAEPIVDPLARTLFDDLATPDVEPTPSRPIGPRPARWRRLHAIMQRRGARDVALSLLVILAAVSVVLATRSGTSTAPVSTEAGAAVPAAPGPIRIISQETGTSSESTLTVSVPGAPRAAILPTTAFEVSVDGRRTPAKVEPVAAAPVNLAVLVNSSSEATGGDVQAVGNGLTELLLQLPAGSRVSLVGSAGPNVLTPITSDSAAVLKALAATSPKGTSAPGAGLRLAAQQVTTAPRLHRAVLLVGSSLIARHDQEISDAALDAKTAGTPIYVITEGSAVPDALRSVLATTGGTNFDSATEAPLRGYDALAADLSNQYRLTFATAPGASAAAVAVNAAGVNGSTTTALDARPR